MILRYLTEITMRAVHYSLDLAKLRQPHFYVMSMSRFRPSLDSKIISVFKKVLYQKLTVRGIKDLQYFGSG